MGPPVRADRRSVRGVDLDGGGPQRDRQLEARERRVGRAPVPPADAHPALPVGLGRHPPNARVRRGRQAGRREQVLLEELRPRPALDVVLLVGHAHAPVERARVAPRHVPRPGDGHEQVAPPRAHPALDAALLVAGVGAAEAVVEAAAGCAALEQRRGAHDVAHAPADAGGAVEHDEGGDRRQALEDVAQALAHAFGVLAGEDLRGPHVGEREARREVAHDHLGTPHAGAGPAGVRLRRSGRPVEVEELVAPGPHREVPVAHVPAHGAPLPGRALGHLGHRPLEPLVGARVGMRRPGARA